MNVATKVAEELDALGLNEDPEETPVEPETPPENTDEPTGVDDPAAEPPTTDREHQAKTAQALARAVDQLGVSFEHLMGAFKEVRSSAHALVESLERSGAALDEMMDADGEEDGPADMFGYGPDEIGEDDSEGDEDDGDDGDAVSQGE